MAGNAANGNSLQQAADPEELHHAVSLTNMHGQCPSPNGLPSQPASINGKPRYVIGGGDEVESSAELVIHDGALPPDQVRALSPPVRKGTPTGPVSIESVVKLEHVSKHIILNNTIYSPEVLLQFCLSRHVYVTLRRWCWSPQNLPS